MNILVFGDSITQGYWAIEHGWVDLIRRYYGEKQLTDRDYHGIYNLGVDGDTSEDILQRIENEVRARIRDRHTIMPIVVVQAGINDNLPQDTDLAVAIDTYKKNLRGIVSRVEPISTNIVFVGYPSCDESKTTPVSWGEYYYTNAKTKAHEEAMREIAEEAKAVFVPVFDEFKKHIDNNEDLLQDGLHPNDKGHQLIADIVLPKLEECLR